MTEKKDVPAATIQTVGAVPPTIVSVPWDPHALKGRECVTCACYFEQANPENPLQTQGFCRRLPADMAEVRMMEPRRDQAGNIVKGKDGGPVMQPVKVIGYLFKATKREGTCFDGWRPQGTLPGERSIDTTIREVRDQLKPMLDQIPKELQPFLAALFGLGTLETKN